MEAQSFQPGEDNIPGRVVPRGDSAGAPRYSSPTEPPTFLQDRPPARIIPVPLPGYRVRWTYIILGVTWLVYILSALHSGSLDPSGQALYELVANCDPAI